MARGIIPNNDREYKRLGSIINDARLAGRIDWNHLEDRTRNVRENSHWNSPADIINATVYSYYRNRWEGQQYYVEVWIEKDALVGVIDGVCRENDAPFFSCRGYTSQSEVWGAAQRILRQCRPSTPGGVWRKPIILHLGDHDPSGIDMTRDVTDRLDMFVTHHGGPSPRIERLALNMDQVEQYGPPPNPAKLSDSRADKYIAEYGDDSWELDALEPAVIADLIRDAISDYRDQALWDAVAEREEAEKGILRSASTRWGAVVNFLERRQ